MAATRLMTAAELEELPDDGCRYELVEGVLRQMSPAGFEHGQFAAGLVWSVSGHVRERRLGIVVAADTGFRLARNPDTVLAPDAAFVRTERLPPPGERRGFADLAPDLVIEVVSPSDRATQVNEKVQRYLDAGVRLVWVVYPTPRTIVAFGADGIARTYREGDVLDGGAVLPEFRVPVADVFA